MFWVHVRISTFRSAALSTADRADKNPSVCPSIRPSISPTFALLTNTFVPIITRTRLYVSADRQHNGETVLHGGRWLLTSSSRFGVKETNTMHSAAMRIGWHGWLCGATIISICHYLPWSIKKIIGILTWDSNTNLSNLIRRYTDKIKFVLRRIRTCTCTYGRQQ